MYYKVDLLININPENWIGW